MKKMSEGEIEKILEKHLRWLRNEKDGKCADLSGANLRGANLNCANLRGANLNCSNLRGADLVDVDLRGANLKGANLIDADLIDVDLRGADLSGADLRGTDLRGADLDFSIINLSCKDLNIHLDDRLAIQRLYHLIKNVSFSINTSKELKKLLLSEELIKKANEFHRAKECGEVEWEDKLK